MTRLLTYACIAAAMPLIACAEPEAEAETSGPASPAAEAAAPSDVVEGEDVTQAEAAMTPDPTDIPPSSGAEAGAPAQPAGPPAPPPGGRGGGRVDRDGDGEVTRAENQESAMRRFDRMDSNGDGVLSADEFAAVQARWGGAGQRGGPRDLTLIDRDGDGAVTRAEATAAASARFDRLDADGDGVLSDAERPQRGRPPQ